MSGNSTYCVVAAERDTIYLSISSSPKQVPKKLEQVPSAWEGKGDEKTGVVGIIERGHARRPSHAPAVSRFGQIQRK